MDGVTLFGAGLVGGGLAILGVAVLSLAQRYGFALRRRPVSRSGSTQPRRTLSAAPPGVGVPTAAAGPTGPAGPGPAGSGVRPPAAARSAAPGPASTPQGPGRPEGAAPPAVRERRPESSDLHVTARRRTPGEPPIRPFRPRAQRGTGPGRPAVRPPGSGDAPRPDQAPGDGGFPRAAEVYARAADVYARAADIYARAAQVRGRPGPQQSAEPGGPVTQDAARAQAARAETVQLGPVPAWSRPVNGPHNEVRPARPSRAACGARVPRGAPPTLARHRTRVPSHSRGRIPAEQRQPPARRRDPLAAATPVRGSMSG